MTMKHRFARVASRIAVVATVGALAGSLAACSGGSSTSPSGGSSGSASDLSAALQKKSSITVWGWAPQLKPIVAAFEKKYPNVTVKLENVGTGNDQYTKLQNAIKAGSGAPDVAQIEYYALPQFALSGSLEDLTAYGAADMKSDFSSSTWGSVNINNGIYGLPQDSGPMALFYRTDVFKKYGLKAPVTWDEYVADAKIIHDADPKAYITNDTGDAGFTTSMIWQAGGKPYTVKSPTAVDLTLPDDGAKKWTANWNKLIDSGELAPTASWSDEWYKSLADGSIASILSGAWFPGILEGSVADASGKWAVAPMPVYNKGDKAAAENGGGADAVLKQSKNKLVAYGFTQFMNGPEGEKILSDNGGFPAGTSVLNDASFLDQTSDYFNGQKINEVLVQASKDVVPGWSYLPFQTYANSIFGDTVGQAYANKTDLDKGLKAWETATAKYGNDQGFTVTAN